MAHTLQLSSGQYASMACLQKTEQWYALWCPNAQNKNFSPTLEAAIILWVGIESPVLDRGQDVVMKQKVLALPTLLCI